MTNTEEVLLINVKSDDLDTSNQQRTELALPQEKEKNELVENLYKGISCGYDKFKQMVYNDDRFVDKTQFISQILACPEKALLLTRPRKFGKSLNLDMLYSFLRIQDDPMESETIKTIFNGGETMINGSTQEFRQLNISKRTDDMKHLGQYPVIFLSLSNCTDDTYIEVARKIKANLLEMFLNKYSYLKEVFSDPKYMVEYNLSLLGVKKSKILYQLSKLESKERSESESCDKSEENTVEKEPEDTKNYAEELYKKMEKICDVIRSESIEQEKQEKSFMENPEFYIVEMLTSLCQYLCRYHRHQVFIIIDDYDRPASNLMQLMLVSSKVKSQYDKMKIETLHVSRMISNIVSSFLNNNEYCCKIVLAGIYNNLLFEGDSGLNKLKVYGSTDPYFSSSFGFAKREIKEQLLKDLDLEDSQEGVLFSQIKQWYGGYIQTGPNNDLTQIYAPFSIIRYINCLFNNDPHLFIHTPSNNWSPNGNSLMLLFLNSMPLDPTLEVQLHNLLINDMASPYIVPFAHHENISLSDEAETDFRFSEDVLFYALLNSGYLALNTVSPKTFKIPNQEAKQNFNEMMITFIKKHHGSNFEKGCSYMSHFIRALYSQDEEYLENCVKATIFELLGRHSTDDLHLIRDIKLFLSLLSHCLRITHTIALEEVPETDSLILYLESKEIDPKLQAKQIKGVNIVLEIKIAKGQDLLPIATEAVKAANNKAYLHKFSTMNGDKLNTSALLYLCLAITNNNVSAQIKKTLGFISDVEFNALYLNNPNMLRLIKNARIEQHTDRSRSIVKERGFEPEENEVNTSLQHFEESRISEELREEKGLREIIYSLRTKQKRPFKFKEDDLPTIISITENYFDNDSSQDITDFKKLLIDRKFSGVGDAFCEKLYEGIKRYSPSLLNRKRSRGSFSN